ncbi:dTDP-4-dehydrorhamnose reductase [Delftia tsuruhatensis]|jgi:dTDP-4-dehydrorhamnose reductase|uniref:dTDP-4-dehydrorhamnose reductase n=1 Tax=Delftia TaxID=80865 RepID=UPI00062D36D6|nr:MULTISPECIES: dTDP-4-dehydrorhamnose reductase [Delftia]MDH0772161.1 dTDP-4-dehydrorhamnose reductase [Delftia tsuruhatensis]MDH1456319.1 dTDP-4-dehydrorhamnose reductase [Delftia tsuruhatensis]MDH1822338.1 dTDP-4-dehydrorhamnose reductase [Delftia tsuruhatensis]WGG10386.1 dTDP-4-dehydrorhamnose reductase [Delftia tsuruhatensis]BDE74409.1 NAD(P)-dependent oxidoreductase [Delftia lacustris]
MKLLLLGRNGQVGWELQRSLAPLGELIALDRQDDAGGQGLCGDLSRLDELARTVRALRPDVIVNAAAHTAVDKAESEPEQARLLNALAPQVLAREAAQTGALLVHYSTDYVFDGSGSAARTETEATAPLSVYGGSKLEGEQLIQASGCRHLIFRTSWVYAARGGNFAKTMLRLAQEREALSVIDDQWGAPTGADLIADVTAHAIRQLQRQPGDQGLYHLVAGGETTWHAYASHVIARARELAPDRPWKVQRIAAVPTSAFPTPAQRPHNSRLNTDRLQQTFGLRLPHWQAGVDRMLQEII